MKDLKTFLAKYQSEEGIDYAKAEEALNEHINGIVAKQKPDDETLLSKSVEKIISELGIEGNSLDDVKTYIKKMGGNTDEIKELNLKLEKELKTYQDKVSEYEGRYNQLESTYQTEKQFNTLKGMGFEDEKAEFIHYKVNKLVNDETDFDTALKSLQESNPDYFKDTTISTGRRSRRDTEGSGDAIDVSAYLKK